MGKLIEPFHFLLVEDSAEDAWLVSRALKDLPRTELHLVSGGDDAIAYLQGWGKFAERVQFPVPHAIIMDWRMPRGSGLDFLTWRRERAPESLKLIPVVVLSDSTNPKDAELAQNWGANGFLAKTAQLEVLTARLKQMAERWMNSELPACETI